jgi:hypothetical protein
MANHITKRESNIMPMGKGTYGSKVGRPSKAAKAKGMKKMAKRKKK